MNHREKKNQKGRGAQINPPNPYHQYRRERMSELESEVADEGQATRYTPVYPKTMLNKVDSPDIGMGYSMNPYQGCEHGCAYCYARNTHPYWGYSAGLDFEREILIKQEAPRILESRLRSPKWKVSPIMLAGNTDCYQPAERQYMLTRQLLGILWKYRHPVGIITKNKLVLRDIDLLRKLAGERLLKVSISITTLQRDLQQHLEPRTSTPQGRLETVERLSEAGVPVNIMAAPIIPGLNEHEIFDIARETASRGARSIHYTMVRLNGDVGAVFSDWLERFYPDRKEKVLAKIRASHGGQLNDSRFGTRMTGEGAVAEIIRKQIRVAREKYFQNREMPSFNLEAYEQLKNPQMRLF